MNDEEPGQPRPGQLLTGVTWAVLLLGLWLWGSDVTAGGAAAQLATTGDAAAVGRPSGRQTPPRAPAPTPTPSACGHAGPLPPPAAVPGYLTGCRPPAGGRR
ncbi:hypothetical protein ACH4Q6_25920 [Streptomyces lydicus]|uniref:hypothetical protein n=1 Tax=Streptomyces lydicus TaxID=47763 RepID=UPI0037AF36A2